MHNRLAVFNTDSLNRAGILFPSEVLIRGFLDHGLNGMPYLLNHDFHKRLGWTVHNALLLQPAMVKTIGNIFIPETEEESQIIQGLVEHAVNTMQYQQCSTHQELFLKLLGDKYSPDGRFFYDCCVSYISAGILSKTYPNLIYDKDGLIYLDDLFVDFDYVGSGIFAHKREHFCVFAHQYFRRNLSLLNSTNNDFLDRFISWHGKGEYKLRIALDADLLGLKSTYQPFLEQDFAWGPQFSDDISSLPDGVCQYLYPQSEQKFSGIQGMEFWWKSEGHEKTMEAEEICTEPSLGISNHQYGCRYVHSIYDSKVDSFFHFDGAIRLYEEENIMTRWDTPINKAGKNTVYTKLFRIDGKFPLENWKELIIFYFRGNKLPYEYFGVKNDLEDFFTVPEDEPVDFNPYVPYKTSKKNGIQLFISTYLKGEETTEDYRTITDIDQLQFGDETLSVCESPILEVQKILARRGQLLDMPVSLTIIKPYDFYTNFPTIRHSGPNAGQMANETIKAFQILFSHWNKRMQKTASFAISIPLEDREVKVSIFGQLGPILDWMDWTAEIPSDKLGLQQWLTDQSEWIRKNFDHQGHTKFQQLIKPDGIQLIKREFIEPGSYNIEKKGGGIMLSFDRDENAAFIELMEKQKIFPTPLTILSDIRCSKTGEDYRTSKTSKVLDDDVTMVIYKAQQVGAFWTDRPYY